MFVRNSLLVGLAAVAAARDVPANVKSFYDAVRANGQCSNPLKSGFHSISGDNGCKCFPFLLEPAALMASSFHHDGT